MQRKTRYLIAGGVVVAAAGAAGAGVVAANNDDAEAPVTGDAYDKASAAALAHTGGGTVSGTEVGDEEGYYEVEVTLDDGSQVDVHLTEGFDVIGSENDGVGDSEDDGSDD